MKKQLWPKDKMVNTWTYSILTFILILTYGVSLWQLYCDPDNMGLMVICSLVMFEIQYRAHRAWRIYKTFKTTVSSRTFGDNIFM